ncbi:cupin domain-containing protein [Anditalea andensis]|uniref:Cupin type-1 domain-containing protein n=1 Tax=Anditalea andensis TaxID=1048983 RepID=A0A074L5H3_9BACT|nr:cupin domain-containing protein [Anditalea andensis]KEO75720.1 hypothetical protein EL17_22090 [Anditalea andensis]
MTHNSTTELYYFMDDGLIPNSKFALILYRQVVSEHGEKCAVWMENSFYSHNWTNTWRWGIYKYHHYHSNTHEVLGVLNGSADLLLGGKHGETISVMAGDVMVIPAGVGHKCLVSRGDFEVVGAYPDGIAADLLKGELSERPKADENIKLVPLPNMDPIYGADAGLKDIWGKG